jgi:hypothetical protein
VWAGALAAACAAPGLTPTLDAQGSTRVLVVVGLGGTAEFRERFHEQAATLRNALIDQHRLTPADVVYLGERVEVDPDAIRDRSTRDNVLGTLADFAAASGPADRVMVVLIGHGTSSPAGETFNLAGPDLTPADLASAFSAFGGRPVALVHTGSGSGAFLQPLAGPNRIVVTATRTARELNATRFGGYFVDAFSGEGADIDRDGAISLLEAYTYARDEVARHYERENQIQTEHAMLDDDGDGAGTHEAGATASVADGRLAATFSFGPGAATAVPATDDPALAELYRERAEIQARIDELRGLGASLEEDVYLARMEDLLIELALKNREIRAAGGDGP